MNVDMKPIHVRQRPAEVMRAYCTVDKSIELLDYREWNTLTEGIEKMSIWAKNIGPQKPTYTVPLEITKGAPKHWVKRNG